MNTTSGIQRAVEAMGAGGQAALARAIGVTPQAVGRWLRQGRPPAERCREIEEAVDGKVARHDLRPDLFDAPTNGGG